MSEKREAIKIKADVFWCQHNKLNDMSGKYQVNLCNLSDAAVTALEDMGLSVQEGEDKKSVMGKYILCKSDKPLRVVDTDNDPITEAVGNGSKGKALVSWYPWSYKNKTGRSPQVIKLVITDLVEYAATNGIDADDEDVL